MIRLNLFYEGVIDVGFVIRLNLFLEGVIDVGFVI